MGSIGSLSGLSKQTTALPAPRISELVLQTSNYVGMREWYQAVLGLPWAVENQANVAGDRRRFPDSPKQVRASDVRSCFMFLDRSLTHGQVLALFELPELSPSPSLDPGLNHLQFRHASLPALLDRVELLMNHGIEAHRASNHGPMTSYYFCDPDSNVVELCCNNFDDAERLMAFINSEDFKRNPSGVDHDPRGFLERFRKGEPIDQLLRM